MEKLAYRVHYICSIDKRLTPLTERELFPQESLQERWAIRQGINKQQKRLTSTQKN
jgi:hypothetical protein